MNLEERLDNLEKRLVKLEKTENRRRALAIIKVLFYLAIIIGLVVLIFVMYNRIMEIIAPFQEIVNKYNDTKDIFTGLIK